VTLVVGLTGGIGSGKSAAADEFARLGAAIVDTDVIAHELTGSGGLAIPGIRKLFGEKAIGPDIAIAGVAALLWGAEIARRVPALRPFP